MNSYMDKLTNKNNSLIEHHIKGLFLDYASGNIVLLVDEGVYHLKYKDIIFMKPIRCKDHDKRLR